MNLKKLAIMVLPVALFLALSACAKKSGDEPPSPLPATAITVESDGVLINKKGSETIGYEQTETSQSIVVEKPTDNGGEPRKNEPAELKNLLEEKNENKKQETAVSQMRPSAIREAAQLATFQKAMAWRYGQLASQTEEYANILDTAFNFSPLLLTQEQALIMPPMLAKSGASMRIEDGDTATSAKATYELIEPARYIASAPTWREFLMVDKFPQAEEPNPALLPKTSEERKIWREAVREAWREGIEQADQLYADNVARMGREYRGIMLYHLLTAQHLLSKVNTASADLGRHATGNKLNIGQQVYRITKPSSFILNPGNTQASKKGKEEQEMTLAYPNEPKLRWEHTDINELLLWGTNLGMSDLCLRSGMAAWMRVNGVWQSVTQRAITGDELFSALERLTKNNSVSAHLKASQSDYDFAHQIEESRGIHRRYRGNATPVADGYTTGVKIVFRAIPGMPPALDDLEVEPEILAHSMPSNGLVLVTGVMGSGKSTLLAAILREIIEKGGRHVASYESPIEFDFDAVPHIGGPVSQSAIPEHLKSFLTATRNSTRTAPDVVLIGESRDPDTLRGMIESAEIGVAAYSTVHTRSVPETISRIINVFPIGERLQVTATLLASLRLIISQRLLPLPDGSGRIALREYLVFTPEIREWLLDAPPEKLIQHTEELLALHGQQIQEAALLAYQAGKIRKEDYAAILAERKNKEDDYGKE